MRHWLHRRRYDEAGQALLIILGVVMLLTTLPALVVSQAVSQGPITVSSVWTREALQAAQAAVSSYENQLAANPSYAYLYCSNGVPGTGAGEWTCKNVPGKTPPTQETPPGPPDTGFVKALGSCSSTANWDTLAQRVGHSAVSTSYQYVVDNVALSTLSSSGTVYVFATGRAGVPSKEVCRTVQAAIYVQGPDAGGLVSAATPANGGWTDIQTPSTSTQAQVVLAGGSGGQGGNGSGIGGSGAAGGLGEEIQVTFNIPGGDTLSDVQGKAGSLGSGGAGQGWGAGGAGGNDSGGGGGAGALCVSNGSPSCTPATPVCQGNLMLANLPSGSSCVLAVAAGGGGGGEGVCLGSPAGAGGNGGFTTGAPGGRGITGVVGFFGGDLNTTPAGGGKWNGAYGASSGAAGGSGGAGGGGYGFPLLGTMTPNGNSGGYQYGGAGVTYGGDFLPWVGGSDSGGGGGGYYGGGSGAAGGDCGGGGGGGGGASYVDIADAAIPPTYQAAPPGSGFVLFSLTSGFKFLPPVTQTYASCGPTALSVPHGATELIVNNLAGAGGAGGGSSNGGSAAGGGYGALISSASFAVNGATSFSAYVGCGGVSGTNSATGGPGYGTGGSARNSNSGGGGGGSSAVCLGSSCAGPGICPPSTSTSSDCALAVAGAGGGGGESVIAGDSASPGGSAYGNGGGKYCAASSIPNEMNGCGGGQGNGASTSGVGAGGGPSSAWSHWEGSIIDDYFTGSDGQGCGGGDNGTGCPGSGPNGGQGPADDGGDGGNGGGGYFGGGAGGEGNGAGYGGGAGSSIVDKSVTGALTNTSVGSFSDACSSAGYGCGGSAATSSIFGPGSPAGNGGNGYLSVTWIVETVELPSGLCSPVTQSFSVPATGTWTLSVAGGGGASGYGGYVGKTPVHLDNGGAGADLTVTMHLTIGEQLTAVVGCPGFKAGGGAGFTEGANSGSGVAQAGVSSSSDGATGIGGGGGGSSALCLGSACPPTSSWSSSDWCPKSFSSPPTNPSCLLALAGGGGGGAATSGGSTCSAPGTHGGDGGDLGAGLSVGTSFGGTYVQGGNDGAGYFGGGSGSSNLSGSNGTAGTYSGSAAVAVAGGGGGGLGGGSANLSGYGSGTCGAGGGSSWFSQMVSLVGIGPNVCTVGGQASTDCNGVVSASAVPASGVSIVANRQAPVGSTVW